jgi:hypothetical protein
MDTWSVAQMTLDAVFAITLVGIVVGFLHLREKRINARINDLLQRSVAPEVVPPSLVMESPTLSIAAIPEPTPTRTRAPRVAASPRVQKPVRKAPAASTSRTERYLEAVRMYRQGSDKGTIERTLGISFMELELLGRIK